jgi:hypothetical protein
MSKKIEPAEKAPVLESLLEDISALIGTPRSTAFKTQCCVMCGGDASDFKNELSKKEYTLSGICQICQDRIFEPPTEEY